VPSPATVAHALDEAKDFEELVSIVFQALQSVEKPAVEASDTISVRTLGKCFELSRHLESGRQVLEALASQHGVYGRLYDDEGELFADDPVTTNVLRLEPEELAVDFSGTPELADDISNGRYPLAPAVSHVVLSRHFRHAFQWKHELEATLSLRGVKSIRLDFADGVADLCHVSSMLAQLRRVHCRFAAGADPLWREDLRLAHSELPLLSAALEVDEPESFDGAIEELPESLEELTLEGPVGGIAAFTGLPNLTKVTLKFQQSSPSAACALLECITRDVPRLEVLHVQSEMVVASGNLEPLPQLQELIIRIRGFPFPALMGVLQSSVGLRRLDVDSTVLSRAAKCGLLSAIEGLVLVDHLGLRLGEDDDVDVARCLSAMSAVTSIRFWGSPSLLDAGLLGRLRFLNLILAANPVNMDGIQHAQLLRELQINFRETMFADLFQMVGDLPLLQVVKINPANSYHCLGTPEQRCAGIHCRSGRWAVAEVGADLWCHRRSRLPP